MSLQRNGSPAGDCPPSRMNRPAPPGYGTAAAGTTGAAVERNLEGFILFHAVQAEWRNKPAVTDLIFPGPSGPDGSSCKGRQDESLHIDHRRSRSAAGPLYSAFRAGGTHGQDILPGDAAPEGVARGSREHLLFITLTAAVDDRGDSTGLWNSSRLAYENPAARYLFEPAKLDRAPFKLSLIHIFAAGGAVYLYAAHWENMYHTGALAISGAISLFGIVDFFRGLFGWLKYRSWRTFRHHDT